MLKTGVYSFQGDLRRTIDFGNNGIREESKDAGEQIVFFEFSVDNDSSRIQDDDLWKIVQLKCKSNESKNE